MHPARHDKYFYKNAGFLKDALQQHSLRNVTSKDAQLLQGTGGDSCTWSLRQQSHETFSRFIGRHQGVCALRDQRRDSPRGIPAVRLQRHHRRRGRVAGAVLGLLLSPGSLSVQCLQKYKATPLKGIKLSSAFQLCRLSASGFFNKKPKRVDGNISKI